MKKSIELEKTNQHTEKYDKEISLAFKTVPDKGNNELINLVKKRTNVTYTDDILDNINDTEDILIDELKDFIFNNTVKYINENIHNIICRHSTKIVNITNVYRKLINIYCKTNKSSGKCGYIYILQNEMYEK